MMSTPQRPSTSQSGLMQDVPGSFPIRKSTEQDDHEQSNYLSLTQAVHARRAEFVKPKHVRIKIGTWNVAAYKGTEKDVGGWFVQGKGVSEALAGLIIEDGENQEPAKAERQWDMDNREDVATQEVRYKRKQPTLPIGDPGSLPGNDNVGLYVLGLQEVVDISSATEALRPYTDPAAANKWKEAMASALPKGYVLVAEQQLIGLLLLIYASPQLAPDVKSVSTTSVGTGLMGYMGNKGAVTARMVIGDTTRLVFINNHLAAGADKAALERRNWDTAQIFQRTRFEPIQDSMDLEQTTGEQIGDEDFAFCCGDLNYRLEGIPGEDVRRLLMLHTRDVYDSSQNSTRKIDKEIETASELVRQRVEDRLSVTSNDSSSISSPRPSSEVSRADTESTVPSTLVDEIIPNHEDPTSLQTTISSLLPHDELRQQMKRRKAFHDGWREGPITFLPTYKYDIGSVGVFDSSEKKRAPSWCDRILYRTRRDKLAFDAKVREEENAKKKDDEMKASGTDQAGNDDEILYDYDPETDGIEPNDDLDEYDEYNDLEEGVVITKEGFEDEIQLEHYMAHQRVLSSDHKPLNAVFLLKYDAVVPELKAKVHAEVAKDLDKAENEGRPNVTVVVDQHGETQNEQTEDSRKSFEGVWFGDVRYGQSKHRSLTIANTSRVPASFTLIERPVGAGQAAGIAPNWLNLKLENELLTSSKASTTPFTVEPGETASLEVEIRILDISLVQSLNDGSQGLDEVLVLRVDGGRDHFIPVRAKWLDTSLSQSINRLIRIPEGGIRKLQQQKPDSSKSRDNSKPTSRVTSPVNEEPVRFSAPRELFKLTAALEELGTRVIAEWDMISSAESQSAPWVQHPGWPFEEECWPERSTLHWENAMSDVCNALDSDEPLEASFQDDLPRSQRLGVISLFLMLFLRSMPDGIVDEQLWSEIDARLADYDKAKHKPTHGEQRTVVQEILSQSPSHSISFILLTSMLDRILQEIAGASQSREEEPSSPSAISKPLGALRRVTGTFAKLPPAPHREQASTAYARIFAKVIFRSTKETKKANEKRQAELIEVFLKKDEPG